MFCWAVSVNYLNIQTLAKQDREERSLKAETFIIPDMKNYSQRKYLGLKEILSSGHVISYFAILFTFTFCVPLWYTRKHKQWNWFNITLERRSIVLLLLLIKLCHAHGSNPRFFEVFTTTTMRFGSISAVNKHKFTFETSMGIFF